VKFINSRKCLLICVLAILVNTDGLWSQRMSVASNQVSPSSNLGSSSSSSTFESSDSQAVAQDPLSPEGEIEDPLAPVREQIGTTRSAFGPDRSQTGKSDEWSVEFAAEYGYVWNASLSNGQGNVNEESGIIALLGSKRLDEGCVGIVGANWQIFTFGFDGSMPLPENLQGLNAIFGGDFEISPEWFMRIQVEPGVYGTWNNINWHNVNMPAVFAWTNILNAEFQWFIALRADVFQFFPVLPVPGIRWQPAKEWLFNLSAPKPTINYAVDEEVNLFAGGEILGVTARLPSNDSGTYNNRSLAGTLVNYFEARMGAGVNWSFTEGVSLQGEAGAMVWRTFDLPRLNESIRSTMAPYAQISLRGVF